MVRECRPPAREPATAWLARRSTMATSTRANASSAANISPVGPPPVITTACFVMAMTVPHDPGLAASRRVWHKLESGGEGGSRRATNATGRRVGTGRAASQVGVYSHLHVACPGAPLSDPRYGASPASVLR